MKIIKTNGITYLEKFNTCTEWYWGTDYACGDLYEAEEVFLQGKRFEPNRLIFVHYPDGTVFEPIGAKENQYFGRPVYMDGAMHILLVNFEEKLIRVIRCAEAMDKFSVVVEIPLSEVKDCYNLMLDDTCFMVYRQGSDNHFQIVWPEKADFPIGERESFFCRKDDRLYFTEWSEETVYSEEIKVREFPTGNLIEKMPGTIMIMPDKQNWILR